MHVGTHIDALGHFSIGDRLYNGLNAAEIVTDWGLDKLGIEHAPPMIARGVLLDVAGLDGGRFLNPGRAVSPDELQRAADTAGVSIEAGDIVLIRTGWGRFFGTDNARYVAGEPGIDVAAARWLTSRDVVAIGCDNMAVEVLPNPDRCLMMPVHQHVLAEAGVYLIENLALDEIASERLTTSASSCWRPNTRAPPAARCAQSPLFNERNQGIRTADIRPGAGCLHSRFPPRELNSRSEPPPDATVGSFVHSSREAQCIRSAVRSSPCRKGGSGLSPITGA